MNFKDSNYYKIYADIWNFHKQFCEIKTNDGYWQQVVGTADMLYEKYSQTSEKEFVKRLVVTVLDELERRDREKRENEQSSSKGVNLKKE